MPPRVEARRQSLLLTGGSGFLGSAVTRAASNSGWDVAAPTSSALDVRDRDAAIAAAVDLRPTTVIHLAYRKGDNETTVGGSLNMALAATESGSRLIHMSTDVVFAGGPEPYDESADPHPANEYGRQKFAAEQAVKLACPTATIVRTSLLYGTTDLAPLQLDVRRALSTGPDHQPMTFFTDEYRCPAHVDDVATALVALAGRTDFSGLLHVAGPERISRAEFAVRTARWMGLRAQDLSTSTISEAGLSRPANVILNTARALALGIACRSVAASYTPNIP